MAVQQYDRQAFSKIIHLPLRIAVFPRRCLEHVAFQ
jgi:hypothetical protein